MKVYLFLRSGQWAENVDGTVELADRTESIIALHRQPTPAEAAAILALPLDPRWTGPTAQWWEPVELLAFPKALAYLTATETAA